MAQFNSHQWIDAQLLFHEVKRKYSYSKYARLAELRIADADFEQEKFSDAIREYKDFIHAHRSEDEEIAYARSRVAESMYAEIPESFLMPAGEERDQASVVDTYKELRSFLSDYPSAKESAHVRDLLGQVTARLIRHELYVARFYLGKDNFDAAVARIQYALRTYPDAAGGGDVTADSDASAGAVRRPQAGTGTADAGLHAEALLLLGETYLKMHKWPDARQAFEVIVRVHDGSAVAEQARNYLASLRARGG